MINPKFVDSDTHFGRCVSAVQASELLGEPVEDIRIGMASFLTPYGVCNFDIWYCIYQELNYYPVFDMPKELIEHKRRCIALIPYRDDDFLFYRDRLYVYSAATQTVQLLNCLYTKKVAIAFVNNLGFEPKLIMPVRVNDSTAPDLPEFYAWQLRVPQGPILLPFFVDDSSRLVDADNKLRHLSEFRYTYLCFGDTIEHNQQRYTLCHDETDEVYLKPD
ncbi:MAG: hypothetical protein IJ184_05070 [Alphaproteobacteria bacterium]|nr:hypothetical protein [Alphaproteobacteria bacterium]